jgi:hypothetical protein
MLEFVNTANLIAQDMFDLDARRLHEKIFSNMLDNRWQSTPNTVINETNKQAFEDAGIGQRYVELEQELKNKIPDQVIEKSNDLTIDKPYLYYAYMATASAGIVNAVIHSTGHDYLGVLQKSIATTMASAGGWFLASFPIRAISKPFIERSLIKKANNDIHSFLVSDGVIK